MNTPLDELYLSWLQEKVGPYSPHPRSHWKLLKQLYDKEFVWFVPNDDNRIQDGLDLRTEFLHDGWPPKKADADWMGLGCSVLEMIIGLSRRLAFEAEGDYGEWFWHLIENVGLAEYDDRRWNGNEERINDKLDVLIFRTYDYDGDGGLFPLRSPKEDQRRIEMWYQLSAYVLELDEGG